MNHKFCAAQTAIVVFACSVSLLAHAQITKCIDHHGKISYTNSGCENASAVAVIDIDDAPGSDTAPVQRGDGALSSQVANTTPLHPSAWAYRLTAPGRKSPDAQTVSAARQALSALDRAVASMRTTKVASNE